MFKMEYDEKNKIYQFGGESIQKFVDQSAQGSSFNETQRYLVFETIINFIDLTLEEFMSRGYYKNPVWLFQALIELSDCSSRFFLVRQRNKDPLFQLAYQNVSNYMSSIRESECQPDWILSTYEALKKPLQLACGSWYELGLHNLQEGYLSSRQTNEGHQILRALLKSAIDTVTQSDLYQKSLSQGGGYYEIKKKIPELKIEPKEEEKSKKRKVRRQFTYPSCKFGFFSLS